jgi:hypothetical protein
MRTRSCQGACLAAPAASCELELHHVAQSHDVVAATRAGALRGCSWMGRAAGGPWWISGASGRVVAEGVVERRDARDWARDDSPWPAPARGGTDWPAVRMRPPSSGWRECARRGAAGWSRTGFGQAGYASAGDREEGAARRLGEQREGLQQREGVAEAGGPAVSMRSEHVFAKLRGLADRTGVCSWCLAIGSQESGAQLQAALHRAAWPPPSPAATPPRGRAARARRPAPPAPR